MIRVILCLFCFLLTAGSTTAQGLTIDSCYSLAQRNYPLVKQYELIEKTKEYTLSNASKAYLPQLSINAIEGYVFGDFPTAPGSSDFKFIGIAQVNQTIWDGNATKAQKDIIKASSEAEKASVDVALHELKSRVNQVYFGILIIDEQLKQLAVQDTILGNNMNRIQQLNQNGLAYKTDLDEIKVEQIKLNQQKTEFSFTRKGYVMMLSLLIGIKLDEQATLQKPVMDLMTAGDQISRPELSLLERQRELANAKSEMRNVNLMPKVGLVGAGILLAPEVNLGPSSLSSLGVAGLSASWNLGGLYRNSNDKKITQQELNKINVQSDIFLFNTKLQMTQAEANIEKQKAILADDENIVSLRKTIREGYQLKYDNGVSPLHDFLNATAKESEARSQKALHEMQLLMTLYDYKTISGK
jgi:outer membrane protein TolC